MAFEGLEEVQLRISCVKLSVQVRVWRVGHWERVLDSRLDLHFLFVLAVALLGLQHFGFHHVSFVLFLLLGQSFLQIVYFCLEPLFLEFHDHFLLHYGLILLGVFIKGVLVFLVHFLSYTHVFLELSFFLLNSSVIYFLEISLFLEFVVSGFGFLCDDPCFIEFLLVHGYLICNAN